MATEASEVTEARRLRVWALAQALKAHGYAVEIAESLPLLAVPAACGPPVVAQSLRPMTRNGDVEGAGPLARWCAAGGSDHP